MPYPGDRAIERRIKSLIRWNAMAMVVRQNKYDPGIGGHISTYASLATLLEVGFNHFFHAQLWRPAGRPGLFPGPRLAGRLRARVSGRPADRGAPQEFPARTARAAGALFVPAPLADARFLAVSHRLDGPRADQRHLPGALHAVPGEPRADPPTPRKIWAFLGDGEMDEPESMGSLTLASREKLDNLIFVINCNLQRLDGPVRGNGKMIQELEAAFRGAGWNVIKVIWGGDWDALLRRDTTGLLKSAWAKWWTANSRPTSPRMALTSARISSASIRELLDLVAHLSDDDLMQLRRGGHDPQKVYNAYQAARGNQRAAHRDSGPDHQRLRPGRGRRRPQHHAPAEEAQRAGDRALPRRASRFPFRRRPRATLRSTGRPRTARRWATCTSGGAGWAGTCPAAASRPAHIEAPPLEYLKESLEGSAGREVSSTMAFVRVLTLLMKHPQIGKRVVPIIPDEARTFGMESLFRQFGIYASQGQLYKPHDAEMFLYYKESKDGQILEEGITEAGSMASFTAAGTAYVNYGVEMIPFFIYYSMFGFQRVGDLIWAFGDARGKGFLCGGTAGRTTLAGEGLQHQDGHSSCWPAPCPPARSTIRRTPTRSPSSCRTASGACTRRGRTLLLHHALQRELPHAAHARGPRPRGRSARAFTGSSAGANGPAAVQLFGSGPILNEALRAQQILAEKYGVPADVWSVTSYNELRREALAVERWNRLHPDQPARTPHIVEALGGAAGPIVAATDYMKVVADQMAPWLAGRMVTLGTDGFGRSDNREHLRGTSRSTRNRSSRRRCRGWRARASSTPARRQRGLRRAGRRHGEDDAARGLSVANMQTGQRVAAAGMVVSGALAVIKIASAWRAIPRRWWRTAWNPAATCSPPAWCCWR